jgi:hypothetical protein
MPPHWGSIFGFLDQRPTANRATSRSRYPAYFKLPSTDTKTLPKPETSTLISKTLFVLGSRANRVRDYPRTQELRLR